MYIIGLKIIHNVILNAVSSLSYNISSEWVKL